MLGKFSINPITALFLYVLLVFGVTPAEYSFIAKVILYLIFVAYILVNHVTLGGVDKRIFIAVAVLFTIIMLSCIFSQYDSKYKIEAALDLLILLSCLYGLNDAGRNDKFLTGLFLSIMFFQFCFGSSNQEFRSAFASIKDPNLSAYVAFLLFCLSLKFKIYPGALLSLIYNFYFDSRAFWIMVFIFILVGTFKNSTLIFRQFTRILSKYNMPLGIFFTFITASIFSVILSVFWVLGGSDSIDGRGGLYSVRDTSNKMRFISNLIGVGDFVSNKNVFMWGYGDELLKEWGIGERGDGDTSSDPKLDYVRVVQPHNTYINLFLRGGLLFGLAYLFGVAFLFSRTVSVRNVEIFFSFLFNSFFLHGLLSSSYLVFIFLVLAITKKPHRVYYDKSTGT